MVRSTTLYALGWIWLALCGVVQGDIMLPKIFSDHMVLQQNADVAIWGTAEPGDVVIVQFMDQNLETTADPQGRWRVTLRTPAADRKSHRIAVSVKDRDPKIVISDVKLGEVWICSGQSNMEWPVNQSLNPETEVERSQNWADLRLYSVDHMTSTEPLSDFKQSQPWDCCSPETIQNFSAVAYYFGRELHRQLDVPIGLIDTSYGGTRAEAWTPWEALESEESLQPLLKYWRENDNPTSKDRPANLYNAMVAPLRGLKFRGVIWYQGESNVGRGSQYATLFPVLIESWRAALGEGSPFPFLFVQLAPYRYTDRSVEALPEVWDAQLKTLRSVENTGMVVTTDVGNVQDIHPRNKQAVGLRLAHWALATTYADQLGDAAIPDPFSGPLYREHRVEEGVIRILFDHAGEELKTRDGQPPTHFTIAGEDGKFFPAHARIDGTAVVVSSPEVPHPVAVRFGWDDASEPNLMNAGGLPASPFRTDDFPLLSVGNDF